MTDDAVPVERNDNELVEHVADFVLFIAELLERADRIPDPALTNQADKRDALS